MMQVVTDSHLSVPSMPAKGSGIFSPSEDPVLKQQQFNNILSRLLENVQAMNNKTFLEFLEIDKNVPEYKPIEIVNSSTLTNDQNSLVAMEIGHGQEEMLLLGNKEGTTLEAIKNFVSFSSNDTGELEVYKRLPGSPGAARPTAMTLIAKHGLKTKATYLLWMQAEKQVIVGLDDGHILIYTFELKITPIEFKEKLSVSVNNRPVTGIAADRARKLLYVITDGRRLRTVSLESGQIINGSWFSPKKL